MAIILSDEKLSCFLDGELLFEEMKQIEIAVQKDEELRLRVENLARADHLWQDAVSATHDEIPDNIMAMLRVDETSPANDNIGFKKWLTPVAASIAFALGLTLQSTMSFNADNGDSLILAGQIEAGNPLFAVLENTPSAQSVELQKNLDLMAKPVLTFATSDGNYCREYIVDSKTSATRNVACRGTDSWEVLIVSRTKPVTDNEYKTVGAETDQAVDTLIDEIIVGIPFESDVEQELLNSSWKNK